MPFKNQIKIRLDIDAHQDYTLLTIDEARDVYLQLHAIFGQPVIPSRPEPEQVETELPYPIPPIPKPVYPEPPFTTTCENDAKI